MDGGQNMAGKFNQLMSEKYPSKLKQLWCEPEKELDFNCNQTFSAIFMSRQSVQY